MNNKSRGGYPSGATIPRRLPIEYRSQIYALNWQYLNPDLGRKVSDIFSIFSHDCHGKAV